MGDVSSEVDTSRADNSHELVLEGVSAAPGIAIGTVFYFDASIPEVRRDSIAADDVESEIDLLDEAITRAEQELDSMQFLVDDALEEDGEAIIEAQTMMLRDEQLRQSFRDRIRSEKESAAAAVKAVLDKHRRRLEGSNDAYFRDRAGDIVDLEKRILGYLERGKVAARIGRHSVIVAQTLTATNLLRFSRRGILGCVITEGGPTSHVAIIARALGLPTVVGVSDGLRATSSGDRVIVDGDQGCVIVEPEADTVDRFERRHKTKGEQPPHVSAVSEPPPATTDGHSVVLRANVELEEELDLLDVYGAEGIGLLRTEMAFLGLGRGIPSEERQEQLYRQAGEAAGTSGATIRLLDLGGEKRLPVGVQERNPALGWRGIRILLDRVDDLLRPQLRAILRANAHGNLRLLVPMVGNVDEVRRLRVILEEVADELSAEGVTHDPDIPLGIMVEVPAMAILADAFAGEVDFFSVGTNDLTQYVLAIDRGNERVSGDFDALHPAVLSLIQKTVQAGRANDCPVEICGESAGDLLAVPILLGLGVDALSTSPQALPGVARVVRQIALDDAETLARDVLTKTDAEAVRRYAQTWFDRHVSRNRADDGMPAESDGD